LTWFQTVVGDHPASDIAFIVFALGCALSAWLLRRRPRMSALCLSCLAVTVGLAMAAGDPFLHPWDERVHAVVARHLLAHPGLPILIERPIGNVSLDWMETRVWLHKPPLALWLMAAGRAALGTSELALRIPAILLHAFAVYACARLGPALFGDDRRGRSVGLWAAFLFAINGEMVARTSGRLPSDHPDADLISLIALAALAAVRARNQLRENKGGLLAAAVAGALSGAAVLAKSFPGLLGIGLLAVTLPWRKRPGRSAVALAIGAAACGAIALPWLIAAGHAFPAEAAFEQRYAIRHFFEPLEGHDGSAFFHLARIPRFFGELSPVALLWFFASRRRLGQPATFLALWFAVPYAIFSFAATKMAAYPLVAMPAIDLMIALALVDGFGAAPALASSRPVRRAATMIVCAALVLLPVRYCVERWKPFFRDRPQIEQARQLRQLARALGPGPGLITGVPDPIAFMFYSDWTALRRAPTPQERDEARARGWPMIDAGQNRFSRTSGAQPPPPARPIPARSGRPPAP
jgi:hypothetical protein